MCTYMYYVLQHCDSAYMLSETDICIFACSFSCLCLPYHPPPSNLSVSVLPSSLSLSPPTVHPTIQYVHSAGIIHRVSDSLLSLLHVLLTDLLFYYHCSAYHYYCRFQARSSSLSSTAFVFKIYMETCMFS